MSTAAPHQRPVLGLRQQPGRLALAAMRMPRPLYHHGLGKLLGHTFLLIAHEGRTTCKRRETVAMAVRWNREAKEAIVCSAWGDTQWLRNLRAKPALEIQIAADRFTPQQHFLNVDEAADVAARFREQHPWRLRLFSTILGWGDLSSEQKLRQLVQDRPFVAFRPIPPPQAPETAEPEK